MTAKIRVSHTGHQVLWVESWVGNFTRQVPAIFGQSAVGGRRQIASHLCLTVQSPRD
jgi:hypothetical protein